MRWRVEFADRAFSGVAPGGLVDAIRSEAERGGSDLPSPGFEVAGERWAAFCRGLAAPPSMCNERVAVAAWLSEGQTVHFGPSAAVRWSDERDEGDVGV